MYKLIATDLDETLISHDHTITQENKDAIQKAIDKGVKIVLATGRGFETVQHTLKDLGLNDKAGEYVISFNGGALTENKDNTLLELVPLKRELAEEIFTKGKEYGDCIHVYTKDKVYVFNMTDEERDYLDGRMPVIETDETNLDFIDDDIIKLLFVNTDFDYLKSIENDLSYLRDDVDVSYSAQRYIEFNPKGITKGKGLSDLCDLIGIDLKDTIAIGDNFNDLPMIQAAGLGVGVANTNEEMKDLCDVITENDYNHSAIAEVIEKFILNEE